MPLTANLRYLRGRMPPPRIVADRLNNLSATRGPFQVRPLEKGQGANGDHTLPNHEMFVKTLEISLPV